MQTVNRVPIRHRLLKTSKRVGILLPLFLFVFLGRASLHAQTTAQLSGSVQDTTGAIIPSATVSLINEDTKLAQTGQSNPKGLFAFPSLTPGTYTVKVEQKGFAPKEVTGIVLHAGDDKSIPPVSLAPGSENTSVTVEASADFIPTENGARSTAISMSRCNRARLATVSISTVR